MPSTPLSPDRSVEVKLHTRLDNEAINLVKDRTTIEAAVARLALLVPPARLDLIDTVMGRVGRRSGALAMEWPPYDEVCRLAYRVKRVHAGEVRMRGTGVDGGPVVVDVISYEDTTWQTRQVYRVHLRGVFVGEAKTTDELARWVDLATLEEEPAPGHG